MLTPAFAMRQTCTVKRWKERGISADVYEEPTEVKCRISMGRKLAKESANYGSTEVVADGTLYLPAGTQIKPKDIVVFGGQEYRVITSRPRYDFSGAENHVEVTVGGV